MFKFNDNLIINVMEISNEAFFIDDLSGNILNCNTAACKMYGYEKEELIGLNIRDIVPKDADYLKDSYSKNDIQEDEFIFRYGLKKDGTIFPIMVNSKIFKTGEEERLIAFVRDITVEEQLRQELFRQSYYDFLTGLINRRHIFTLLNELSEATCITTLDLDDFKMINDSFGHYVGDEVLKKLGKILNSYTHLKCGRLGGEEFIIIHRTADIEEAKKEVEEIQRIFYNETLAESGVTFSAGTALWKPGMSIKEILKISDSYLYESKKYGKNMVTI